MLAASLLHRSNVKRSLAGIILGAAILAPCAISSAQDTVEQPLVDNSRFRFSGTVNTASALVRSGPADTFYPTMKLNLGDKVTVVGIHGNWLKIVPPEGSYSLVSKAYIERRDSGSIGRVMKDSIRVRAGSVLNPFKTSEQTKLNAGTDVTILGEQDEYYKIPPPADAAFLYIDKQFVDPGEIIGAKPKTIVAQTGGNTAPAVQVNLNSPSTVPSDNDTLRGTAIAAGPTTQSADPLAIVPATRPAETVAQGPTQEQIDAAQADFEKLEQSFTAASAQSLDLQPVDQLTTQYQAIVKNAALPETDKRTAGFRLAVLTVRADAQRKLADVRRSQVEADAKAKVLQAEQAELQERLDATKIDIYTAVGTLQASSLQFGAHTLFRLVDPATGRTVVYLRGDGPDVVKLIGQFVGVRGETSTDTRLNLRVIPITEIMPVDPSQVNGKIAAGIIPPSMLPRPVQASATN